MKLKRFISVFLCCVICLLSVSVSSFAANPLEAWITDGNTYNLGTLVTSSASKEVQAFLREWSDSDSNLLYYDQSLLSFVIFDENQRNLYFEYSYANYGSVILAKPNNFVVPYRFVTFRMNYCDSYPNVNSSSLSGNLFVRFTGLYCGTIFDNYLNINSFPYIALASDRVVIHDDLGILSPLPVVSHNLTINYQYEDGSVSAPSYAHSYPVGDSYNVASPIIDGYTPDVDTVSGTMSDSDITVAVTYHKDTHDPVLYDLTIDYLYGDGAPASVTYNAQFPAGETYNVPSPIITGYTPDRSRVVGVMPESDVREEVIYTENKPPPIDPPIDPPVDPSLPDVDPEYVAFHLPALYEAFITIRANVGSIFSVCIWCFLIILSVRLIAHIVGDIGQ